MHGMTKFMGWIIRRGHKGQKHAGLEILTYVISVYLYLLSDHPTFIPTTSSQRGTVELVT